MIPLYLLYILTTAHGNSEGVQSLCPSADSCLTNPAQAVNLFVTAPSRCFTVQDPDAPLLVNRDRLCKEPAMILCDKRYNPAIAANDDARETFNRSMDQVTPAAISNLLAGPQLSQTEKSQLRTHQNALEQLPVDIFAKVEAEKNRLVDTQLYSTSRRERATSIVNRAKASITAVLRQRQLELPANDPGRAKLQEMEARLNSIGLDFGSMQNRQAEGSYNAFASSYARNNADGSINQAPTVWIQGMITQVDNAPESFYMTMMHELSHHLGPDHFHMEQHHPFYEQTLCLGRDDSIGAKLNDTDCYTRTVAATSFPTQHREAANKCISTIRNNAFEYQTCAAIMAHRTQGKFGNGCQRGQFGESFADWLSSEALAREGHIPSDEQAARIDAQGRINLRGLPGFEQMSAHIAGYCTPYQDQVTQGGSIMQRSYPQAGQRADNHDQHPLLVDRINGIIMANPQLKAALGCDASYTNRITTMEAPTEITSPLPVENDEGDMGMERNRQTYCGSGIQRYGLGQAQGGAR